MPLAITDRARLEHEIRRRKRRADLANLPLLDFIHAVTPDFSPPRHLMPVIDLFEEAAATGNVRGLVSTPPQHGKSQTAMHGLVWLLLRRPKLRHAYGTYSITFAQDQNRIALGIAKRAGLQLEAANASVWMTPEGGGIAWTGIGGALTGKPVDGLLVFDDLLKNRLEAESPTTRRHVMDWLSSVAMTRVHPKASVIGIATRWVIDDPHGQLIRSGGKWQYVKLPAIKDDGTALWPEARPLEWLEQQRTSGAMTEYDWWALYMCEPRPRGGAVYKDVHYYDTLPEGGYREAHGFDAAYTAKTYADYSVTITGRQYGDHLYLTNMIREQLEPRHYAALLREHGIKEVTWFRSGTEKGLEGLLRELGIKVDARNTLTDKFVRSQPAATAWNTGKILVPRNAPWLEPFLNEVLNFTGVSDTHDDIPDALAALHAKLSKPTNNDALRALSRI